MTKVKRILIECTNTYQSDLNIGIQRVVRNIVNNGSQIGKELDIECLPVIAAGRNFLAIDKIKSAKNIHSNVITHLKNVYKKIKKIAYTTFPILKKNKFAFFTYLELGLIDIVNYLVFLIFSPAILVKYLRFRVVPKEGDILILLDASWTHPIWPAVQKAKKNGATVSVVIHDLIPLLKPAFFEQVQVKRFSRWLDASVKYADCYIAVSQTVRDELKDYLLQNFPAKKETVGFDYFKLGSVIDMVNKKESVRKELQEVFENPSGSNVYLSVGTIELRKNHSYVLDAFDEIWEHCPDVRLCVVGRVGWCCDEIIKRIENHNKLGEKLFVFNDASDVELAYCYEHAKSLIFASKAEGYGLPIVEGLYNKLPVLVSDIPVHREVGGEFCSYFDIADPENLSSLIIDIEKTGVMPSVKNFDDYEWASWEDSCRELFVKAVALGETIGG